MGEKRKRDYLATEESGESQKMVEGSYYKVTLDDRSWNIITID
jgi:hypothetical protein